MKQKQLFLQSSFPDLFIWTRARIYLSGLRSSPQNTRKKLRERQPESSLA